jgi:Rod binding domain-containing protein
MNISRGPANAGGPVNRLTGGPPNATTPAPSEEAARLRKTALQLEGLFVQRMFAAMRDTVPDGGMTPQSSAEGTFTQLLDEKMSEQVPSQWNGEHSLANALYEQLRRRLTPPADGSTGQDAPR